MNEPGQRLSVVVGASQGIGRHLAARAAQRGDQVLAIARGMTALQALRRDCDNVRILSGDALAGELNTELRSQVERHDGPVTFVISAATIGPVGPLTAVNFAEWSAAIQQNLCGTASILSAVLPVLASDDLVVVFTGGGAGGPNAQPNVSSYTTSKAALMHLVEVLARENSASGPALVAIAPGAFPTAFTDPVIAAAPEVAGEALLADVRNAKQLAFDTTHLDALFSHLETNDVRWLSGSSVSAKRDLDAIQAAGSETSLSDLYRLRRVDGSGVVVNAW